MLRIELFVILAVVISVNSFNIPFIEDVTLIAVSTSNSSIVNNLTCEECLCKALIYYSALNCFSNNTCQLFSTIPLTYRIQSTPGARLYFSQQTLPNVNQCCMPDLDFLLSKLRNATPIYVSIPNPRCLALDNHGYIVAIERTPAYIDRFNATNLTLISRTSIPISAQIWSLAFNNNAYYIGTDSNTIVVVDSNNLTMINTIVSTYINNPRDIMFLDNGQTMVIASFGNNALLFFKQLDSTPGNYSYAYQKAVTHYPNPHGLWYVNDTFFYATVWYNNAVLSYTANSSDSTSWTETVTINAESIGSTAGGSHVIIDECGRSWFVLEQYGIEIYDTVGNLIGNFSLETSYFFHLLITDNYVLYLTDTLTGHAMKIDPNIKC
ncbi:unnamed protein product [Adineta steineri]|uniref:Uncharacterized protein n=2 Tax=Adineta steineri TaxID=433720 RepID=A0A814MYP0_9BILA|nr:unnamed protein product [Adineta steineri]CAF4014161.1 unnamed protein product [Adineta steineri]